MEKLINKVRLGLGLLITVIISCLASCNYIHDHGGQLSYADSVAVANIAQQTVNPKFATPAEAQAYADECSRTYQEDSVFRSMTQKQIFDVTTVLINQGKHPTANEIAQEFLKNINVYSNLPEKDSPTAEEVPRAFVSEHDTLIDSITPDGHHYRIIKTKED